MSFFPSRLLRAAWLGSFGLTLSFVIPRFFDSSRVSMWHPAWLVANYWQFGFIRRGFVGSLLFPIAGLVGANPLESTLLIYVVLLFGFCTSFWLLAQQACDSITSTEKTGWRLFVVFLCLAPFSFQHFGYDAGRTDLAWLLFISICLLVLTSASKAELGQLSFQRSLSIAILGCAALLTYESCIFFVFPLVAIAILFYGSSRGTPIFQLAWKQFFVFASAAVLCFGAIITWGDYEMGPNALSSRLSSLYPGVYDSLSKVLANDLVSENISLEFGRQYNWFSNSLILFLIFFSWLILLTLILISSDYSLRASMILAAPFVGLVNNVFALDYPRYMALSLSISAMSVLYLVAIDSGSARGLRSSSLVLCPLLLTALLGPLGIVPNDVFPLIRAIPAALS